eukprot:1154686-Pelagomonas_calceolata.AAC.1
MGQNIPEAQTVALKNPTELFCFGLERGAATGSASWSLFKVETLEQTALVSNFLLGKLREQPRAKMPNLDR